MEIVRSRAFSGLGSSSNTNSIITSAALLTTSILSLQLHSVLANNIAVRYSFMKISSGVVNYTFRLFWVHYQFSRMYLRLSQPKNHQFV